MEDLRQADREPTVYEVGYSQGWSDWKHSNQRYESAESSDPLYIRGYDDGFYDAQMTINR